MKDVFSFLETGEWGWFDSMPEDGPDIFEVGEPYSYLLAEADPKQMSLDSEIFGNEDNENQKLKLGAEHMAHSSSIEGGISSFKGETALESSSLGDLFMDPSLEFAIRTLTGSTIPVINEKKVDEITGPSPSRPSVNTPSDEMWADPCFAFAVKILTGEIPIEDGLCSQKIVQQPYTSSRFQGYNGLELPNIGFEEFGQANFSCFGAPKKSCYK